MASFYRTAAGAEVDLVLEFPGWDKTWVIEQDHRFIKRITRAMPGFKNFWCAQATLAEIELMRYSSGSDKTPAEWFYSLAA